MIVTVEVTARKKVRRKKEMIKVGVHPLQQAMVKKKTKKKKRNERDVLKRQGNMLNDNWVHALNCHLTARHCEEKLLLDIELGSA